MIIDLSSTTIQKQRLTPPLKWAGGKRWLVPVLLEYWSKHQFRRYVEPFCGGLAAVLGLMPETALLNDVNPHLINFYRWIQRGLSNDLGMLNERNEFLDQRMRFNSLIKKGDANSRESALLFYYLNRTGYNGLCRFNKQGEFNVPFGRYKTINYAKDFAVYQDTFQRWTFSIGDFGTLSIESEDFIYADPPYDVEFVSYSKEGFSWEDQERLAEHLAIHTGPVIISNQATSRIETLYTKLNFKIIYLDAPRRISSDGNRTPAKEILALRNLP